MAYSKKNDLAEFDKNIARLRAQQKEWQKQNDFLLKHYSKFLLASFLFFALVFWWVFL